MLNHQQHPSVTAVENILLYLEVGADRHWGNSPKNGKECRKMCKGHSTYVVLEKSPSRLYKIEYNLQDM